MSLSNLPANAEAERSVLGAILSDAKAYDEAASIGICAEEFSLDSHRRIYQRMEELALRGSAIDTVTLINLLDERKELARVGDVGYVGGLLAGLPDRPSIRHYARIVKEKAAQRKVISACNMAIGGVADQMSSGDAMEYLQDQILQIQTGSDEAPAERVGLFSDSAYAAWLEMANSDRELIGLSTGIPSLNYATTGIREGEIWAVGARTGHGKTNLALQIAAASCREEVPVGFFSIEMDRNSLLQRLWSSESGVPFKYVRYPKSLTAEVQKAIEWGMVTVGKWPLFITEDKLSLSKMLAKAKLLIRREKVKLLIVDYVQKVSAPGRDERAVVTKVSEGLRDLAKSTGVPIVLLSQFSRPDQTNRNKRPTIYDFKESGSLENDAHVGLLIYRPKDELDHFTGYDEIIVGKQRNGEFSIESVRLTNTLRFEERIPGDQGH